MPTPPGLAAAELATQMLPHNTLAWQNYAVALNGLSRFEEALAAYDRSLTLDSTNAATYNNRGNALLNLGRFEEALAVCDRALTLNPPTPPSTTTGGTRFSTWAGSRKRWPPMTGPHL